MSDKNFSLPTYAERNEVNYFELDTPLQIPGDGQAQKKNGYRFTVNDRSALYDWSRAYFDITLSVELLTAVTGEGNAANNGRCYTNADNVSMINGIHSVIRRLNLTAQNGSVIYNQDEINKCIFIKKLLELNPNSATKQNEYWYLDRSINIEDYKFEPDSGIAEVTVVPVTVNKAGGTENQAVVSSVTGIGARGAQLRKRLWSGANRATTPPHVNFRVPLVWYSYFQSLRWQNLLFTGMQLTLNIDLENDDNLIWRPNASPIGRVVVHSLKLALPQILLRPQYFDEYLKFVSSGTPVRWTYLREKIESSQPTTAASGRFKINSVYSPKKVFVWFLKSGLTGTPSYLGKQNDQQTNFYLFDDINGTIGSADNNTGGAYVKRMRLEFSDGAYYPRSDYIMPTQLARIYGDVLDYSYSNIDMATGSQYTREQFAVNSMFYFDLEYAKDLIVNDARDMTINYDLSGSTPNNYQVYVFISEEHTASYGMLNGSFQLTDEVTMRG